MPDGVCVVWASFLMDPLEVVCRRPRLTLVAMRGGGDTSCARVAHLTVITTIVVSHGHGPLRALLVPLLAALDALLSTVYGDLRRRLLIVVRGHLPGSLRMVKHNCLIASGVLGGDVSQLLKCVPKKVPMIAP
jgi:hypothetical protein